MVDAVERATFFVGVNVFVVRNETLLLGMRKGSAGDGEWGLPGGHVELGECMKETGRRELEEETGMHATDFLFTGIVNQPRRAGGVHYMQVGMHARDATGEPELKEPECCYEWKFFPVDDLPKNIFFGHATLIENFFTQQYFLDDTKCFGEE